MYIMYVLSAYMHTQSIDKQMYRDGQKERHKIPTGNSVKTSR